MRSAVALVALGVLTAVAAARPAGQGALVELKIVSQTPSAWTSRAILGAFDHVLANVEACGGQRTKTRAAFSVTLDIEGDGTVGDMSLDRALPDTARACLRPALAALTLPAPRRRTTLRFALYYRT